MDSVAPTTTAKDATASMSSRQTVYRVLELPEQAGTTGKLTTAALTTLILLNVLAAILQTVQPLADRYGDVFTVLEAVSLAVFTTEYFARVWASSANADYRGARGMLRFVARPIMIVDALATFPAILFPLLDLRSLRMLRVFRLIRGLKMARYSRGLRMIAEVLNERKEQLLICFGFATTMVIMSGSLMYYVESDAQPEAFSSIPAGMWWATCMLTTVGYGDVVPATDLGRFLASILSLIGIGLFALPAGILASGFAEHFDKNRE